MHTCFDIYYLYEALHTTKGSLYFSGYNCSDHAGLNVLYFEWLAAVTINCDLTGWEAISFFNRGLRILRTRIFDPTKRSFNSAILGLNE